MKRHLATTIIAVGLTAGLLTSCGSDDESPTTEAPVTEAPVSEAPTSTTSMGSGTQVANPASEYCVAQGGDVEIVDEDDGQVGYCNLPDGTRIEEWEYFNQSNG
jgi:putative hemolysin